MSAETKQKSKSNNQNTNRMVMYWEPNEKRIKESQLFRFIQWVDKKCHLDFEEKINNILEGTDSSGKISTDKLIQLEAIYEDLHKWSIENLNDFWSAVWDFVGVKASKGFKEVRQPKENTAMPRVRWFVGATANLAENLLDSVSNDNAIVFRSEDPDYPRKQLSYRELYEDVYYYWKGLKTFGVAKGDIVVGYVPNMLETVVAALGTVALGATWASCSPDFGVQGVVERFRQIKPKVLVAADGYFFKGRVFNCMERLKEIIKELDSLELLIIIPYIYRGNVIELKQFRCGISVVIFEEFGKEPRGKEDKQIIFEQVTFDHPCYIMFSSGTTGLPKCLVQGTGVLLNQMKEHQLHCDFKPNERLLYFTTCGWMMWNWQLASLASKVCIVLYDGSPLPPADPNLLFRILDEEKVNYFGTSARFLQAVEDAGVNPFSAVLEDKLQIVTTAAQKETKFNSSDIQKLRNFISSRTPASFSPRTFPADLSDLLEKSETFWVSYQHAVYWERECVPFYHLDAVLVTGSPSSPSNFAFVRDKVFPRTRYLSISGGTEINGCFGNGCILKRIFAPELQCRGLGMDVRVFNDQGESIIGQEGELVCCTPVPSMPLSLWGDNDFSRYTETYFSKFPGIWRHGDYAVMTERYTLDIKGRSDATMNPGGVRIGSAEFYHVLSTFPEVQDAVVVGQRWHGDERIIMFVQLKPEAQLSSELMQRIRSALRDKLSPRHVPAKILQVPEVPYTVNNKKVEIAVKRVIEGLDVPNKGAIQNPECLEYYHQLAVEELSDK
eukprot:jgi/Galph1/784/GphlegSOOS_G5503.1